MTMDIHDQDWFLFMEHSEKKKKHEDKFNIFPDYVAITKLKEVTMKFK